MDTSYQRLPQDGIVESSYQAEKYSPEKAGRPLSTSLQRRLSRFRDRIISCIYPDTRFLAILHQEGILSEDDLERIRSHSTNDEKNTILVQKLKRCTDGEYERFVSALRETKQAHASCLLDHGETITSTSKTLLRDITGNYVEVFPIEVYISKVDSREITVSWQILDSTEVHDVVAEYRFKPIHPYMSGEEQHGHTDRASFTCKGLQPGTKHYIKVFFTGIYMHEQLEKVYEIECRTDPESPSNVILEPDSENTIVIRWDPPDGYVQKYEIYSSNRYLIDTEAPYIKMVLNDLGYYDSLNVCARVDNLISEPAHIDAVPQDLRPPVPGAEVPNVTVEVHPRQPGELTLRIQVSSIANSILDHPVLQVEPLKNGSYVPLPTASNDTLVELPVATRGRCCKQCLCCCMRYPSDTQIEVEELLDRQRNQVYSAVLQKDTDSFRNICDYFGLRQAHIVHLKQAGISVTVRCDDVEALDSLWVDHTTGTLGHDLEEELMTEIFLQQIEARLVRFRTKIKEKEYRKCRRELQREAAHRSPIQSTA